MGLFFVYILKSSVCLAAFYLFYRLLLARETFHRFNRFALLGLLLLSYLLPLAEVSIRKPVEVHQTILTLEQLLMMADTATETADAGQRPPVTGAEGILLLYVAGIVFFVLCNLYSLLRLSLLLKSCHREDIGHYLPCGKNAVLLVHGQDIAPFSWMKFIVVSRKDLDENGREILLHEWAHICRHHSWDLLLADICIFFQWFNPASWLLKQELQNIHEYEADETVIKGGVNAKQYQLLLIKKAVGTRLYSMANSFNHSSLKKRITMMLKEKSNPWARLKYLYVLPLAAIAVTAFARPEVSEKTESFSAVKVNDLAEIIEAKAVESVLPEDTLRPKLVPVLVDRADSVIVIGYKTEGKILTVVNENDGTFDAAPEFPGGMSGIMEYLGKNIRYPKVAQEAGAQGRVVVQMIIDEEGNVTYPEVVNSAGAELDAEAVRVVSAMPKWKPAMREGKAVSTKFTIPVIFRLPEFKIPATLRFQGKEESASPLVIIDGKEVDGGYLKALDADKIASISVLKGESAVEVYGEKGKNGVILVDLKKPAVSAGAAADAVNGKSVDE